MTELAATVVVPTTGDRGPLLTHSVGSVLAQTVTDLEVFIVGDGIDDTTREVCHDLCHADDRVQLVEHPKDVSRGERHRHTLLSERASGRIVAYLCDRDLWLPHHLAELTATLADADVAHTLRAAVAESGDLWFPHEIDVRDDRDRRRRDEVDRLWPLSSAGHTMDAYRRLPHGWRTTPPGLTTDRYMWDQFLDQPWCRVAASPVPTVIYLRRGRHPGWPTDERLRLIEQWAERLDDSAFVEAFTRAAHDGLVQKVAALARERDARQRRSLRTRLRRATGAVRELSAKAGRLVGR